MANLLMQLVTACVLLLSIVHRFEALIVTYNSTTTGLRTSDDFFTETWNYTVSPESQKGVFKILKLNLTDSSLIFFNWPYGETACPRRMVLISREDVVKMYDVTTKIDKGDPPDTFTVQSGTVLCFMMLQRSRYGDRSEFVYTYKDDGHLSGVTITHPRSFRYKNDYSMRSIFKELCISIRSRRNVAFEMNGGMSDKKSLNIVNVRYTERYRSGSRGSGGEQKTVIQLTSRTPESSYKRRHVLPWGYRREAEIICFTFEVVNGTWSDFKDDVSFLVTAFETCGGNMTESSGLFTTDRYPAPQHSGANCTTHITAMPGQRIALSFPDAKIDCHYGFVMLRGLENRRMKNDKMLLCGRSLEDNRSSYLSESNTLSVQVMNKGYLGTDRGYFARYKAIGCGLPDAELPPHSRILNNNADYIPPGFKMRVGCERGYVFPTMESEITLECRENSTWGGQVPICVEYSFCNTTLTALNGTIESPSYPKALPKDTTCMWKIRVKKGQNIKVTILDMNAFCFDNFLLLDRAAKGSPDNSNDRQVLCSNSASNLAGNVGEIYHTWANELTVVFQSNFLKDSGYFKIKYEATGCSMEEFPTNRYNISKHYYNYYSVGSKLEFTCPLPRQYFPTGNGEHYLTCGADGKWNGTFPLCSPQQEGY